MEYKLIVAATERGGIGLKGNLPWRLPQDMAYFKRVTSHCEAEGKQNAVIMGRKTWSSIPARFRPLAGRHNVVISANPKIREEASIGDDVLVATSFQDALRLLAEERVSTLGDVYVIGGASIYAEALRSKLCKEILLTTVRKEFECDTYFPDVTSLGFSKSHSVEAHVHDGVAIDMAVYAQKSEAEAAQSTAGVPPMVPSGAAAAAAASHPEMQYLDLIRQIIESGDRRGDRTGVGTLSKFGVTMRYSLRGESFPLLTTKRVFWRGVAEELLWFISGDTNANTLKDKGVHIWDGNGSREFLDRIGLTEREEMDLGPVYGFQWRHFGAQYTDMHADYTGQGVDQLAEVIRKIKTNPTDRRIIMSAWNPAAMPLMALPPCHMFCQFFVANGELSCQMYQRSADMGLGVPFNIASYALLTRMIAQVCGLQAGDFVHVIGDAHVYLNHVEPLKQQLAREPRPFPKLRINPEKTDIDSFTYSDFTIEGYSPHKSIKMEMAV